MLPIIDQQILNIVLHEPEIPHNTGNIGRLCVGLNIHLHLIEPLGFEITDKHIRRSGLDYWQKLKYTRYSSFINFLEKNHHPNFYFASTKANKCYTEIQYQKGDFIIFGSESKGLPKIFHSKYSNKGITIPMSKQIRSINLSNSCAVIAYEAFRQISLN